MEIKFIDTKPESLRFIEPPKPASLFVPEWYKSMPVLGGRHSKIGIGDGNPPAPNTTVKACSPFLDSLTAGYVWSAPADIEIRRENDQFSFRWRTVGEMISEHSAAQHPGLPPVEGGADFVMKWAFHFVIETPPGYSTFFTHPLNRHDLPFRTFSGVVDTDTYPLAVQFPFQVITKDIEDRIIIDEGTPLCQFFPIKREPWKSSTSVETENDVAKRNFDFKKKIVRAYKSRYWHKKSFT